MATRDRPPGERIRILVARFLGVGFIGYLVVSLSGIGEAAEILDAWWTPTALVLVFAPGAVLLAVALVAPTRIPSAAAAAATGIVLTSVLWFFAWSGDALGIAARGTWLSAFAGLAGLCAALVWRPAITFGVQFVASSTIATIDQLGLFGRSVSIGDIVYAAVWAFGLSAVLTAAVIMALRTGAILDATQESVDRSAADAAAAHAREHERSRFDALIHDRVLATLLGTTRPDTDGRLAEEARSALVDLDIAVHDPSRGDRSSADSLAEQLTSIVADSAALSITALPLGDENTSVYPADVAWAVTGATSEAVRNSILHAGSHARRRVVADLRPHTVRVTVTDTGRGFDTAAIGPGRLGVDSSIVGRMAKLDGGRARIDSTPGEGTTVTLEWTRPS